MGTKTYSTDQWVPSYSNTSDQLITMNLHRFNGDPIATSMPGWHWNTLELLCVKAQDERLPRRLVEIALRVAVECEVEWNEAIKEVVRRAFVEHRNIERSRKQS